MNLKLYMLPLSLFSALFTFPQVNTKVKLIYKKTKINQELVDACPVLKSRTFRPSPWLPFGMMQLLYPAFKQDPKTPRDVYDRETLSLGKRGRFALDWMKQKYHDMAPEESKMPKSLVMIFLPYNSTSHFRYWRYLGI